MNDTPNLDPALLEFFRASLHNPALSPHVRNNMANAFMAQERKNPDLYKDFIALANDENQEERFRAYAIQFLAETRSFSNNSKEVIDQTLTSLAYSKAEKATPLLAAQAQMMMTSLEMQGDMKLPENFNDLQVSVLQDSNADQAAQITALSILGRRNADEHRDIIRQYAETENPAQRTAIAALGQLQNPKDKPIIEAALNSNDYLVKLAAEAALKKFE